MQISIPVTTISLLLFHLATSLTITSPAAGDSLDPTQPITVQWTSSSSDPSTFNLVLDNTNQNSLVKNMQVASSLSTSSGSYIVTTAAFMTYGTGFVFKAEDVTGNVLSTSGAFDLATGLTPGSSSSSVVAPAVSSDASSPSPSSINTDTASTADSSLFAQTTGTDITAALTTATGPSTMTTADTLTTSNGFFTSTTSRSASGSGTRSGASSAASATTSANAQPRTGSSSQIVFSAAGILAGLVALLA